MQQKVQKIVRRAPLRQLPEGYAENHEPRSNLRGMTITERLSLEQGLGRVVSAQQAATEYGFNGAESGGRKKYTEAECTRISFGTFQCGSRAILFWLEESRSHCREYLETLWSPQQIPLMPFIAFSRTEPRYGPSSSQVNIVNGSGSCLFPRMTLTALKAFACDVFKSFPY